VGDLIWTDLVASQKILQF